MPSQIIIDAVDSGDPLKLLNALRAVNPADEDLDTLGKDAAGSAIDTKTRQKVISHYRNWQKQAKQDPDKFADPLAQALTQGVVRSEGGNVPVQPIAERMLDTVRQSAGARPFTEKPEAIEYPFFDSIGLGGIPRGAVQGANALSLLAQGGAASLAAPFTDNPAISGNPFENAQNLLEAQQMQPNRLTRSPITTGEKVQEGIGRVGFDLLTTGGLAARGTQAVLGGISRAAGGVRGAEKIRRGVQNARVQRATTNAATGGALGVLNYPATKMSLEAQGVSEDEAAKAAARAVFAEAAVTGLFGAFGAQGAEALATGLRQAAANPSLIRSMLKGAGAEGLEEELTSTIQQADQLSTVEGKPFARAFIETLSERAGSEDQLVTALVSMPLGTAGGLSDYRGAVLQQVYDADQLVKQQAGELDRAVQSSLSPKAITKRAQAFIDNDSLKAGDIDNFRSLPSEVQQEVLRLHKQRSGEMLPPEQMSTESGVAEAIAAQAAPAPQEAPLDAVQQQPEVVEETQQPVETPQQAEPAPVVENQQEEVDAFSDIRPAPTMETPAISDAEADAVLTETEAELREKSGLGDELVVRRGRQHLEVDLPNGQGVIVRLNTPREALAQATSDTNASAAYDSMQANGSVPVVGPKSNRRRVSKVEWLSMKPAARAKMLEKSNSKAFGLTVVNPDMGAVPVTADALIQLTSMGKNTPEIGRTVDEELNHTIVGAVMSPDQRAIIVQSLGFEATGDLATDKNFLEQAYQAYSQWRVDQTTVQGPVRRVMRAIFDRLRSLLGIARAKEATPLDALFTDVQSGDILRQDAPATQPAPTADTIGQERQRAARETRVKELRQQNTERSTLRRSEKEADAEVAAAREAEAAAENVELEQKREEAEVVAREIEKDVEGVEEQRREKNSRIEEKVKDIKDNMVLLESVEPRSPEAAQYAARNRTLRAEVALLRAERTVLGDEVSEKRSVVRSLRKDFDVAKARKAVNDAQRKAAEAQEKVLTESEVARAATPPSFTIRSLGRNTAEQEASTFSDEAVERNLEMGVNPMERRNPATTEAARRAIIADQAQDAATPRPEADVREEAENYLRSFGGDRRVQNRGILEATRQDLADIGFLADYQIKALEQAIGSQSEVIGRLYASRNPSALNPATEVLRNLREVRAAGLTKASNSLNAGRGDSETAAGRASMLNNEVTTLPESVLKEIADLEAAGRQGKARRVYQEALEKQIERFRKLVANAGMDPDAVMTDEFHQDPPEAAFSLRDMAIAAREGRPYGALLNMQSQNFFSLKTALIGLPSTGLFAPFVASERTLAAAANSIQKAITGKDIPGTPLIGDFKPMFKTVTQAVIQAPRNAAIAFWTGRSPTLNALGLANDDLSLASEGFADPAKRIAAGLKNQNLLEVLMSPIFRTMSGIDEFMMTTIAGFSVPMQAGIVARQRGMNGAQADAFVKKHTDGSGFIDAEVGARARLTVEAMTFKNRGDEATQLGKAMEWVDAFRGKIEVKKGLLKGFQPIRTQAPFFRTGVRVVDQTARRSVLAPVILAIDALQYQSLKKEGQDEQAINRAQARLSNQAQATLLMSGLVAMLAEMADDDDIEQWRQGRITIGGTTWDLKGVDPFYGMVKGAGDFLAATNGKLTFNSAANRAVTDVLEAAIMLRSIRGATGEYEVRDEEGNLQPIQAMLGTLTAQAPWVPYSGASAAERWASIFGLKRLTQDIGEGLLDNRRRDYDTREPVLGGLGEELQRRKPGLGYGIAETFGFTAVPDDERSRIRARLANTKGISEDITPPKEIRGTEFERSFIAEAGERFFQRIRSRNIDWNSELDERTVNRLRRIRNDVTRSLKPRYIRAARQAGLVAED